MDPPPPAYDTLTAASAPQPPSRALQREISLPDVLSEGEMNFGDRSLVDTHGCTESTDLARSFAFYASIHRSCSSDAALTPALAAPHFLDIGMWPQSLANFSSPFSSLALPLAMASRHRAPLYQAAK